MKTAIGHHTAACSGGEHFRYAVCPTLAQALLGESTIVYHFPTCLWTRPRHLLQEIYHQWVFQRLMEWLAEKKRHLLEGLTPKSNAETPSSCPSWQAHERLSAPLPEPHRHLESTPDPCWRYKSGESFEARLHHRIVETKSNLGKEASHLSAGRLPLRSVYSPQEHPPRHSPGRMCADSDILQGKHLGGETWAAQLRVLRGPGRVVLVDKSMQ